MGWNFVKQISNYNQVVAITRVNNRENIERYQLENPDEVYKNIEFLYYDLPYWMRFWKRGSRGALLYYYLWQQFIPIFIISKKTKFDITHNLNFHNDWTPSFLWVFRKPFVWGPIGHHPKIPSQFLAEYNRKETIKDKLIWGGKLLFFALNPFLFITKQRANRVLVMNTSVLNYLKNIESKSIVIPSVASEIVDLEVKSFKEFHIISAGRFVPLKGFDIAIRAFGEFLKSLNHEEELRVKYTIVGDGPYKNLLKETAKKIGVLDKITFVEWMNRKDLFDLYQQANVFLFPSHEGAGMVVSEAMSFGLPVLCFNNCGPGEFVTDNVGFKINYSSVDVCVRDYAEKLRVLFENKELHKTMSREGVLRHKSHFSWEARGKQLKKVYESL